jgi:hypothetical protein
LLTICSPAQVDLLAVRQRAEPAGRVAPFSINDLLARMRVMIRRAAAPPARRTTNTRINEGAQWSALLSE